MRRSTVSALTKVCGAALVGLPVTDCAPAAGSPPQSPLQRYLRPSPNPRPHPYHYTPTLVANSACYKLSARNWRESSNKPSSLAVPDSSCPGVARRVRGGPK